MFNKIIYISLWLILVAFTTTTIGGGKSEHEHKHDSEGSTVGQPAAESAAIKTIAVTTLDSMRYTFSPQLELKAGDIVKFVITNKGKIPHEFSIGDEKEQQAHRKMMRQMPDMVHQDGNTVTVKPGETKVLTWEFRAATEVIFACNVPGHFEAGMFYKMKFQ